ncbi:hypothetical protein NUACC21_62930 [Scytonema sp. NUACC21]
MEEVGDIIPHTSSDRILMKGENQVVRIYEEVDSIYTETANRGAVSSVLVTTVL